MFRNAAEIDKKVTTGRLRTALSDWLQTRGTWFDGSPQSVDRRLAQCRSILSTLQGASGRYRVAGYNEYLDLVRTFEAARDQLEDLREDILAGRREKAPELGKAAALDPDTQRTVDLESQRFFARQAGTYGDDLEELSIRAAHHIDSMTGQWSAGRARLARNAFVDRVVSMGRMVAAQRRRQLASYRPVVYQDFDDRLLFID